MTLVIPKKKDLDIPLLLKQWEINSLELIKRQSGINDISIESYHKDFSVYGHWLTMSTLNSESFKINLKLFFTTEHVIPFCAELFKDLPEKINHHHANDFMKELCNIIIGRIKNDFEKIQISSLSSMPITLRSFNNLFSRKNLNHHSYELYWKFKFHHSEIMCLLSLEILDLLIFQNLELKVAHKLKDGKFEAL